MMEKRAGPVLRKGPDLPIIRLERPHIFEKGVDVYG